MSDSIEGHGGPLGNQIAFDDPEAVANMKAGLNDRLHQLIESHPEAMSETFYNTLVTDINQAQDLHALRLFEESIAQRETEHREPEHQSPEGPSVQGLQERRVLKRRMSDTGSVEVRNEDGTWRPLTEDEANQYLDLDEWRRRHPGEDPPADQFPTDFQEWTDEDEEQEHQPHQTQQGGIQQQNNALQGSNPGPDQQQQQNLQHNAGPDQLQDQPQGNNRQRQQRQQRQGNDGQAQVDTDELSDERSALYERLSAIPTSALNPRDFKDMMRQIQNARSSDAIDFATAFVARHERDAADRQAEKDRQNHEREEREQQRQGEARRGQEGALTDTEQNEQRRALYGRIMNMGNLSENEIEGLARQVKGLKTQADADLLDFTLRRRERDAAQAEETRARQERERRERQGRERAAPENRDPLDIHVGEADRRIQEAAAAYEREMARREAQNIPAADTLRDQAEVDQVIQEALAQVEQELMQTETPQQGYETQPEGGQAGPEQQFDYNQFRPSVLHPGMWTYPGANERDGSETLFPTGFVNHIVRMQQAAAGGGGPNQLLNQPQNTPANQTGNQPPASSLAQPTIAQNQPQNAPAQGLAAARPLQMPGFSGRVMPNEFLPPHVLKNLSVLSRPLYRFEDIQPGPQMSMILGDKVMQAELYQYLKFRNREDLILKYAQATRDPDAMSLEDRDALGRLKAEYHHRTQLRDEFASRLTEDEVARMADISPIAGVIQDVGVARAAEIIRKHILTDFFMSNTNDTINAAILSQRANIDMRNSAHYQLMQEKARRRVGDVRPEDLSVGQVADIAKHGILWRGTRAGEGVEMVEVMNRNTQDIKTLLAASLVRNPTLVAQITREAYTGGKERVPERGVQGPTNPEEVRQESFNYQPDALLKRLPQFKQDFRMNDGRGWDQASPDERAMGFRAMMERQAARRHPSTGWFSALLNSLFGSVLDNGMREMEQRNSFAT